MLLILGLLTAVFTFFGSLDGITSFASLAFITIFGLVSALSFRERGDSMVTSVVPAVGTIGATATVMALLWHLYTTEPHVFGTVVVAIAVVGIELLYFERRSITEGIHGVEDRLELWVTSSAPDRVPCFTTRLLDPIASEERHLRRRPQLRSRLRFHGRDRTRDSR